MSFRQSTYLLVKQAILDGTMRPGETLIETELAENFKVSRTPVREALQRLEQDGLVERNDRGLTVRTISEREIIDIYETRIALEGTAARLAADNRTNLDLTSIRKRLEAMSAVDERNETKMAETNHAFHMAIWDASHNPFLLDLLNRLDQHLSRYPVTTLSYPGRWHTAIAEHIGILDAIESRSASEAEQLATQHFTGARDIRLLQWEEQLT